MIILYKKWKEYNEIQLTKNKMDLNIRKMTNHPPYPESITNYIDICLPDICDIQDLLKILCKSPSHLYAIAQYLATNILYHLLPCLFNFPHSLYLFPKHVFVTLEIIPKSLSPSPVRHSFCSLDWKRHTNNFS